MAEKFPSKAEELEFIKLLGKGFFGEVWKAKEKASNRIFAVKKVKSAVLNQHNLTEQMRREIAILYSVNHPRIVRLHFDFEESRCVHLGMEFAGGGGMFDKLRRSGRFTNELSARYFGECCEALHYLHNLEQKVIHRDIKPENILLDSEDHVKLADFGWSNILQSSSLRQTFCGTLDYLAPEMIKGEGHDCSLDMWNMGVLLYEFLTGRSPFGASSQEATCRNILRLDLKYPSALDSDAKDLIVGLLKLNPTERLTVKQAQEHLFLRKLSVNGASKSDAAGEGGVDSPPRHSVEARAWLKEKALLEAEIQAVIQAKSSTEQALVEVNAELDEKHKLLREAQAQIVDLKRTVTEQNKVIEDLKKQTAAGRTGGYPGGK